ncbi:MAG: VWA domain-containing protein [Bacteroidales bacterium]|nr:VWA domain-containing protein [Bacteroidales bacterium]
MNNISFAHPWALLGLLLVPAMVAWWLLRYRKQEAAVQHSDLSLFDSATRTLRVRLRWLPYALRCVAVAAMVVALARPQSQLSRQEMSVEGIDIVIAMDISGSMRAEDFKPNRLEAAKKVAADFIQGRNNDRMGLVAFAGEAFTQVPLTVDHHVLLQQLGALKSGIVRDGTALGDGLATAINRIKDSEAKSKVIVLLTDGVNNQGSVDPLSAAEIANLYGIRLYTIGLGTTGKAPFPFKDQFGRVHYQNIDVEIDEPLMKQMSSQTDGGVYFRATNKNALVQIFDQIDQMETSKIDVTQYAQTRDEQGPLLWLALACLLAEALVRWVWFKL